MPVAGKNKSSKKRKLHVSFDEDNRREWLTGFSKRKRERREFGLSMQKLKERKKQLELKKQNREQLKPYLEAVDEQLRDEEETLHRRASNKDPDAETTTTNYEDEGTTSRFGDTVIVDTTMGIPESDEEDDVAPTETPKWKGKKDELTLFQRIQKKVKSNMPPKKRKSKKSLAAKVGDREERPASKKGRSSHKQRRHRK